MPHEVVAVTEGIMRIASTLGLFAASVISFAVASESKAAGATADLGSQFIVVEHRTTAPSRELLGRSADAPPQRLSSRSQCALQFRRASFRSRIAETETRYRLPAGLLDAVIHVESAYRPWAVSAKGATGLTQLMPATASMLGVANSFNASMSIEGGGKYLRLLLDQFDSVAAAVAAYNAGPARVRRVGRIPRFRETQRYVARVFDRWRATSSTLQ